MYLDFFGFSEKPFSTTPDLQFLYLGKQHERSLSTLMYGVRERLGFFLLTGEVGAGKTTLSRALLTRLDDSVETSLLVNPLLSTAELLKAIAKDFAIPIRSSSPQRLIESLNRFLLNVAKEKKTALVIIDEAQNLSYESLETIRMLSNLETEKQKLLQILLVGQPELLKKLRQYDLRQLNQRISTRVHLEPLGMVEMMRYVNHRISRVGGAGKVFFEPKAYRMLYRESRGYPRLINLIADRALMASYVKESYVIDRTSVKEAIVDWKGRSRSPWDLVKRFVPFSSV